MDTTFPTAVDFEEKAERTTKTGGENSTRYALGPFRDGETETHELLVLPYAVNLIPFLSEWPAVTNYYAKIPVHFCQQFNEQGTPYKAAILCEPSLNRYARELSNAGSQNFAEPFPGARCALCQQSQRYWDAFNEGKKAAGIVDLTVDEYKARMDSSPELRQIRDNATSWGVTNRFLLCVFDYKAYTGRKEHEGDVILQSCWAPEGIVKALYNKKKHGYNFYDLSKGLRTVVVERNNKDGARFCKYTVEIAAEPPKLDADVIEYLQQIDKNFPNIAGDVGIWSDEQKEAHAHEFGNAGDVVPVSTPVRSTSAQDSPAQEAETKPKYGEATTKKRPVRF